MKIKFLAAAAASAAMLMAGPAGAADLLYAHVTSFYSWGVGAPPQSVLTGFETTDGSSDFSKLIIAPGVHITPISGSVLTTGSVLNQHQAPAIGDPAVQDPTQYLAVHGGGATRIVFDTPIRTISFYVGSFDSFDMMTFFYSPPSNPSWEVGNGSWVSSETLGVVAVNGAIMNGANNGLLTLRFDHAVTHIDLRSGQNAFEIGYIAVPVPEPATWAMMIIGFGGVGALMRHRRSKGLAFA